MDTESDSSASLLHALHQLHPSAASSRLQEACALVASLTEKAPTHVYVMMPQLLQVAHAL